MIARVRPIPREPKAKRPLTILDCIDDPKVFGSFFKNPASWAGWRVFLAALFGLPLDTDQLGLFRQCTGRDQPNPVGYQLADLVIGRRGGKSFVLALIAVYLATFRTWLTYLAPGERATIVVIAADRKQARVIMRYCKGLLHGTDILRPLIENERAESIELTNRITIEVHTASFRTTRGYTIVAALCDELAFWSTEDSSEPDTEVIAALKPGMASVSGAMLLCASSPYARKGALWESYRKHFGKDSPTLVWQAPTRTMNPSIPQSVVDDAMEADPASASAEYLAQFRSDIEAFVSLDAVRACIARGVFERAPQVGLKYFAFTDPSGGSNDSFSLAIAHRDADSLILDCVREVRPPFSPESVVMEFASLLKSYRVNKVTGDRYAGEWPREQFRKNGIQYELAGKPKSDLYRDLLPLINSRRVELLDHQRLVSQLIGLERRTARSGRDSIDHAPSGHDDLSNCVAGVFASNLAIRRGIRVVVGAGPSSGNMPDGIEVDPNTYLPLDIDPHRNPLSGEQGGCIPGRGQDATASLFNTQHNLRR